uniref:Uncharacterized protein n=1 Tax=Heterorhabditis bacteriophora TaxID=37862 RepID=A0A1I7WTN3_HETBA
MDLMRSRLVQTLLWLPLSRDTTILNNPKNYNLLIIIILTLFYASYCHYSFFKRFYVWNIKVN